MASARRSERPGLLEAVGGLEQLGQVVEVDGDRGMLGAIALLVDGERPAQEGLRGREFRPGVQVMIPN